MISIIKRINFYLRTHHNDKVNVLKVIEGQEDNIKVSLKEYIPFFEEILSNKIADKDINGAINFLKKIEKVYSCSPNDLLSYYIKEDKFNCETYFFVLNNSHLNVRVLIGALDKCYELTDHSYGEPSDFFKENFKKFVDNLEVNTLDFDLKNFLALTLFKSFQTNRRKYNIAEYMNDENFKAINLSLDLHEVLKYKGYPFIKRFIQLNEKNKLVDLKNIKIADFIYLNLISNNLVFSSLYDENILRNNYIESTIFKDNEYGLSEKINFYYNKVGTEAFSKENNLALITAFLKLRIYKQRTEYFKIDFLKDVFEVLLKNITQEHTKGKEDLFYDEILKDNALSIEVNPLSESYLEELFNKIDFSKITIKEVEIPTLEVIKVMFVKHHLSNFGFGKSKEGKKIKL